MKLMQMTLDSSNKIAELVNLSVPSVSERMKKLEEKGLIEGYHAILNSKDFHFDITAFLFVQIDFSKSTCFYGFICSSF